MHTYIYICIYIYIHIGIVWQEVFSDAHTVKQHSALCFTKLNGDFLKLSDRTFDLRWKGMDSRPQIGDRGRHLKEKSTISDVSRILYTSSGNDVSFCT